MWALTDRAELGREKNGRGFGRSRYGRARSCRRIRTRWWSTDKMSSGFAFASALGGGKGAAAGGKKR